MAGSRIANDGIVQHETYVSKQWSRVFAAENVPFGENPINHGIANICHCVKRIANRMDRWEVLRTVPDHDKCLNVHGKELLGSVVGTTLCRAVRFVMKREQHNVAMRKATAVRKKQ